MTGLRWCNRGSRDPFQHLGHFQTNSTHSGQGGLLSGLEVFGRGLIGQAGGAPLKL